MTPVTSLWSSRSPFTIEEVSPYTVVQLGEGLIGLDVALGAKFAIDKINENSDIFPNKKVGLLLLDTCDDPLITSDIILELQLHGQINNRIPNISDKILGYAGGFSSSPTLQVADITTELKTVQVCVYDLIERKK